MTNAELIQAIRNEIERMKAKYRKDRYKSNYEGLAYGYKIEAYNELLSFLDTLESEKPMNQDELEKAVVDYFEGYWPGMETAEQCNTHLQFTPPAIMRLARHFAQWGAEHSGSSEIPTNLDEAVWRYVKNKYGIYDPQKVFENEEIAEDFKAGWIARDSQIPKLPDDVDEAAEEYARLDDKGVWKDGGKYKGFIAGAKWAELTWEDVKRIVQIADKLCPYTSKDIAEFQENFQTEEAYYKEVLKQFNDGGKD